MPQRHYRARYNGQGDNSHIEYALAELRRRPRRLERLFEYGLKQFDQCRSSQGREKLSTYFFWVSEISGLPDVARDFALDLSVHLEDPDSSPLSRHVNIRQRYKAEIEPRLKSRGP